MHAFDSSKIGVRIEDDPNNPGKKWPVVIDKKAHDRFMQLVFEAFGDKKSKNCEKTLEEVTE